VGHRFDIEGLRAIAVIAVLLFHFGVPGTDGGYVGVDVFFVISGFLITALLLREKEATGTISLRDFYARRIRRLLPVSFFVVAITATCCSLHVVQIICNHNFNHLPCSTSGRLQ
jgi:peptidoglycan/LPS O-acetylase OafA/YrhL